MPKGKSLNKSISFHPLRFEDEIADVLKVKPEPKAEKKRAIEKKSKTQKSLEKRITGT